MDFDFFGEEVTFQQNNTKAGKSDEVDTDSKEKPETVRKNTNMSTQQPLRERFPPKADKRKINEFDADYKEEIEKAREKMNTDTKPTMYYS